MRISHVHYLANGIAVLLTHQTKRYFTLFYDDSTSAVQEADFDVLNIRATLIKPIIDMAIKK